MTPLNLRPEVKAFCEATETLLSPILLNTPLNQDELGMISVYIQTVDQKLFSTETTPVLRS